VLAAMLLSFKAPAYFVYWGVLPLTLQLLGLAFNVAVYRRNRGLMEKAAGIRGKRIALTREVLANLTQIKISCWEPRFESMLCKLRGEEVLTYTKAFFVSSLDKTLGQNIAVMSSLATFLFLHYGLGELKTSFIFFFLHLMIGFRVSAVQFASAGITHLI
jgi:hypothetical protein